MPMSIATIVAGGLLSVIGILGYALGESHSLTALIPLAFGMPLELCGALSLRPEFRKHAMHGASVVALLAVLGSAPGFVKFLRLLSEGTAIARPLALQMQAAMFVVSILFLILCIRSFTVARAERRAAAQS